MNTAPPSFFKYKQIELHFALWDWNVEKVCFAYISFGKDLIFDGNSSKIEEKWNEVLLFGICKFRKVAYKHNTSRIIKHHHFIRNISIAKHLND